RGSVISLILLSTSIPGSCSMVRSSKTISHLSLGKRSRATVGSVMALTAVYPVFFNIRANPNAQSASSSMIRTRAPGVIFVGRAIERGRDRISYSGLNDFVTDGITDNAGDGVEIEFAQNAGAMRLR